MSLSGPCAWSDQIRNDEPANMKLKFESTAVEEDMFESG